MQQIERNIDHFGVDQSVFLSCRFKRDAVGEGICLVALDLFDQMENNNDR